MKKGFTLIEVFVVIAIIGILGSVILASLGGSRVDTTGQGTITTLETFPAPTDYAVDATGTISAEDMARLNAELKAMDNEKHQFGVLFVKSTGVLSIEEYGIKLAESWKVGKAGLDNGAIIIVATEDKKVRIEVGYGLEGDINDAKAGRIIDEAMIPSLKEGKWADAVSSALIRINSEVK